MNSTRQKPFIKHYLHKNQLWRVLLKYVPATATQMNQRLTPQAAGSSRHTLQGQKWTELKDSQPGLLIRYFVAFSFTIFVLFSFVFNPGEGGETRMSREEHTCCHLIHQVLFFPSKTVVGFADSTSDSFHRSSIPIIPNCFLPALQRTLKHWVHWAWSFLYSTGFSSVQQYQACEIMWLNGHTPRLQSPATNLKATT